jgi:hypothetical protein
LKKTVRHSGSTPPAEQQVSRWRLAGLMTIAAVATGSGIAVSGAEALRTDEAWAVLVVKQLLAGERLYTDSFAGVTPLAFYLQAAIGSAWENSVLALRATVLALSVCIACATLLAGRQARFGKATMAVLTLLVVAFPLPWHFSVYSAWAVLFSLLALAALLTAESERRDVWLVAGAICCGLSIASKHNVGLFTTMVYAVGMFVQGTSSQRVRWALPLAIAVPVALALAPTMVSGALPDFWQQAVANKGVYVREASLPLQYYVNFTPIGEIRANGWVMGLRQWVSALPYLLPVLFVVLLAVAAVRRNRVDRTTWVLSLFGCAGLLGMYPRPDPDHLSIAIPALLLAITALVRRWPWLSSLQRRWISWACMIGVIALGMTRARGGLPPVDSVPSGLPSELHGLSISEASADSLRAIQTTLREASAGEPLLILRADAPSMYLISGVANPTRFDYPLVSPFGRNGQQEVIQSIEAGQIRRVCLQREAWAAMEPVELTQAVRRLLSRTSTVLMCDVYSQ